MLSGLWLCIGKTEQGIDVWLRIEHFKIFWSLARADKFDGNSGVFTNGKGYAAAGGAVQFGQNDAINRRCGRYPACRKPF